MTASGPEGVELCLTAGGATAGSATCGMSVVGNPVPEGGEQ